MQSALSLIQQRNQAATTVLAALMLHGRRGKAGIVPDFAWLEGLLGYVEEFVRGLHYRDEERLILAPLEKLAPQLRPKILRARRTHIGAGGYSYRLGEALANWKRGWPKGLDEYLDNARDYWRLSASHGRLMRGTILPAAAEKFAMTQWPAIEAALSRGVDPLAGATRRVDLEAALCSLLGRQQVPSAALARPAYPVAAGSGHST